MEYEKLYNTVNEYNEAEGTGDVTSTTPGNCYIVENNACRYNKDWDIVTLMYDVRDISGPTKLFNSEEYVKNRPVMKRCTIDGEDVPVSSLSSTYQFDKVGKHVVRFCYLNKSQISGYRQYEYRDCPDLIYVNLSGNFEKIEDGAFNGCTRLQTVILNYPGKVWLHETEATLVRGIWTRSLDQSGNQIKEFKVPEEYVATYRGSLGTKYGANYIMPIGKSISNIDWGSVQLNKWQNSDGTVSNYDYTTFENSERLVVPALTDYIEIGPGTTSITICSGNINYYPPFRGSFTQWYFCFFDENKQIIPGESIKTFRRAADERQSYTIPDGTKYVRTNFLWASLKEDTFEEYQKWPKYAHIMDADTKEIIWPKITYA